MATSRSLRYPYRTVRLVGSGSAPFRSCQSINAAAWAPVLCAKLYASFMTRARRAAYCLESPGTTAGSASESTRALLFQMFRRNTSKLSHSTHLGRTALSSYHAAFNAHAQFSKSESPEQCPDITLSRSIAANGSGSRIERVTTVSAAGASEQTPSICRRDSLRSRASARRGDWDRQWLGGCAERPNPGLRASRR